MGGNSSKYISEDELSDYETDQWLPKYEAQSKGSIAQATEQKCLDLDMTTDAVLKLPMAVRAAEITYDKLSFIEQQLDDYEMISLLFLLYEDVHVTLQVLKDFLRLGKKDGLLIKWMQSEQWPWQKKLIEALCIIQNYQILKQLGYDKKTLQVQFLPLQFKTSWIINRQRKTFYLICESLSQAQTEQFLNKMMTKNVQLPSTHWDYLEMYFLFWQQAGVNVKVIQQVFKEMELDSCYDKINEFVPAEESNRKAHIENNLQKIDQLDLEKLVRQRDKTTTTKDNTVLVRGSPEDFSFSMPGTSRENSGIDDNKYLINSNQPGVVLIINQEDFYTEPLEKYSHLLHENKEQIQLQTRLGTTVDKHRLHKLFTRMKFKVIAVENKPHYEMVNKIEEVIDGISDESSLFICILSHGSNGVVYGANSCKVEVGKIEHAMCKRNKRLNGKPKVLILQSCQGERCQKKESENMDDNENNATDGASTVSTADVLTFWATIPGYAAIRNTKRGSWFIQALCDEIEENNNKYHLLDICTMVNKKVTRKEWKETSGINIMVPMLVSTLTKSFFLPPLV